jgi:dolichol-phosphate mannosyltransferase
MKILKLFTKFSMVGASGVLVNMAVFSSCLYFGIHYMASAVISFLVAVSWNFCLNSFWTFRGHAPNRSNKIKYISFFVISSINFLVNLVILKIMVDSFGVDKIFSQFISIGIASGFNFAGNYLITYKEKNIISKLKDKTFGGSK